MSFDQSYDLWCKALNGIGFAVEAFLNPPASEVELRTLQDEIGFALPDDLRALYLKANGQVDVFRAESAGPGEIVTPFFGAYDFISIERALTNYRLWKGIFDEYGAKFHESFNEGIIRVREGDPVYPEYWRPGWLPFSIDGGGNSYAVDLSPPTSGTYGQVIVIGSDEDERRVLAPSISAFLEIATTRRLEFEEGEGIWYCFDIERLSSPTS
jgi:cell wall assembly regulator SMI1